MATNMKDKQTVLNPCDLVMVGGITSGIVYPAAIAELHETYRFRCIGGTSAGAIAASATAAAEFYRQKVGMAKEAAQQEHGFNCLKQISRDFASENFLPRLFKAPTRIQPLMDTLLAYMGSPDPDAGAQFGRARNLVRTLPDSFLLFTRRLLPLLPANNPTIFAHGQLVGRQRGWWIGGLLGIPLALIVMAIITMIIETTRSQNLWIFLICLIVCAIIGIGLGLWAGTKLGGPLESIFNLIRIALEEVPGVKRKDTPGNYFGLCTGHDFERTTPPADPAYVAPLTDWLHEKFNKLAGLKGADDILTFGMLKSPTGKENDPNGITLQMVTTNLSHSQPYTLPAGLEGFIFNEDEMQTFFPPAVVRHLKSCHAPFLEVRVSTDDPQEQTYRVMDEQLPPGFHFLPAAGDLPVALATRMSLSFPILLSAVPLYTINYLTVEKLYKQSHSNGQGAQSGASADPQQSQLQVEDLQLNWFSDGGISSNFPIHFFDAWLPTCPTFGINFSSMTSPLPATASESQETAEEQAHKQSLSALRPDESMALMESVKPDSASAMSRTPTEDVYLPQANDELRPDWSDIGGKDYIKFFSAVIGAAMNYRDTMQSRLPSYRDRIVQIRFEENEGGLNLNMTPQIIEGLMKKGSDAGIALRENFHFDAHQWVRFQVLMALLEKNLEEMKQSLAIMGAVSPEYDTSYLVSPNKVPYERSPEWCKKAQERVKQLLATIESWEDEDNKLPVDVKKPLFSKSAPEPIPVLRVTPEF